MIDSSKSPQPVITDEDIDTRDVRRRTFLKGLGIFTGVAVLGLTAVSCKDDPVSNESDPVDDDPTDDFDLD